MSRFISNATVNIYLDEEKTECIEVKKSLSYEEMLSVVSDVDVKNDINNAKMALPLLKLALVKWNLKDEENNDVECNAENIAKLDSETVISLSGELVKFYFPEKKNLIA